MRMLEALFWLGLLVGMYPYALYPIAVALVAALRPRRIARAPILPRVTVAISAYNEARHIEATIRNKLSQEYPPELLDVVVASDGSADGTDAILAQLAQEDPRVSWFRQEPRQGKTAALNTLVSRARGEIVVFSDANSLYRPDTVRRLAESFADARVGYVTGRMIYVDHGGTAIGDGCSAYMRYENWLRERESAVGSIVGVDGGVDAVRRSLYVPMRADQLPDFVLPLKVVSSGYRVVFEPRAHVLEESLNDSNSEFRMRVRVSLRAFWALRDEMHLLNPLRDALFAWQLWSHKVLRYMSFLPLGIASVCGLMLAPMSPFYGALALAQVALALAAWMGSRGWKWRPLRFAWYFVLLNAASAVAFVRFLRGQKQALWQPRTG
jgi:cellulose synthase/poly-beta-1,6-N-acetylglucosamine synthase-like glycosyltransferase